MKSPDSDWKESSNEIEQNEIQLEREEIEREEYNDMLRVRLPF